MKHQLKRGSILSLLILILILMLAAGSNAPVLAEEELDKTGELRFQIERIDEGEKGRGTVETELDKTFPQLFEQDTRRKIIRKQYETSQDLKELKKDLFPGNVKLDRNPNEMSGPLFAADYAEPRLEDVPEEDAAKPFSPFVLTILVLVAGTLLAIVFWLIRKVSQGGTA